MSDHLRYYWDRLRSGLWFVPLLIGLAFVALAHMLVLFGGAFSAGSNLDWLLYSGDAETARETISTLISGMITMTSLVVSIMMVVLTLAAGQLGPRLIRKFTGDTFTQVSLGIFLATILYLLVVLRNITDVADGELPHLAITLGTLLPMLCLFVLLALVHRLAGSIMSDTVIGRVTRELQTNIGLLLLDKDAPCCPPAPERPKDVAWLTPAGDGYIESIDYEALVAAAKARDARIWIDARPGHFVAARGRHIAVAPPEAMTEEMTRRLCDAIVLGAERTSTQDLEYGVRQLVEIALRALSPGINDPFSAHVVIDNLSACLGHAFARRIMPETLCEEDGAIRLVRAVSDHAGLVGAAFDRIRQSGADKPAILIHLADAIGRLAPYVSDENQRACLFEHLEKLAVTASLHIRVSQDLRDVEDRIAAARDEIGGKR